MSPKPIRFHPQTVHNINNCSAGVASMSSECVLADEALMRGGIPFEVSSKLSDKGGIARLLVVGFI